MSEVLREDYLPHYLKTLGGGLVNKRSVGSILDCSTETLVLLGVVVLKSNLEFHSLKKLSFLLHRRLLKQRGHCFVQTFLRNFASTKNQTQKLLSTLDPSFTFHYY